MIFSKSNRRIIEIKGNLYSGNVSEIQQEIEYNLQRHKSLVIILNAVKTVDMSGVFMLYLMKLLAKEKNLELKFVGMETKIFKSALSFSGLNHAFL